MLILMDHDQILLEKRPSRGIWGGLLSFPEIASEIDVLQYCQHQLGFTVQASDSFPVLRHTFTHFRLSISPKLVQIAARPTTKGVTQQRWLAKSEALKAAIPSPVRRLLLQI